MSSTEIVTSNLSSILVINALHADFARVLIYFAVFNCYNMGGLAKTVNSN